MKTKAMLEAEVQALTNEVDALRLLIAQSTSSPRGLVDETLHGLQVYQEELRAQNEDLQQAQAEIEKVSARNRDLFDYSPTGYFVVNEVFSVIDANIAGMKMLGVEKSRIHGKPFLLFVDKKSRKELYSHFLRTKIAGRSLTEVWLTPGQHPAFPVILESVKLGNEWGGGWRCLTIAMDITERKKSEEIERRHSTDLEAARDRLSLIIDCMPQHIAVLDDQGIIVMVNKAWRDFSVANGGPENFCIGDFYGAVCKGTEESECAAGLTPRAILDVIKRRSSGISLEYPCHSPNEKRWFKLDISPLTGAEFGAVVSHANITSRKLMEIAVQESRDRFSDFAKASSDWYWEMDGELRFTWFSDRFAEVTGLDPKLIIGKTRGSLIAEADQAELSRHHDDLSNRRPFRDFDYAVATSMGRKFLRISGVPIFGPGGGFVGYRGTGTDATTIKEIEIQLRDSKLAAEAANRAKSDFLSGMSHELRTPLNAVLGFAEVLLEGYDTPLTDKQRGYVNHILAGGSHLLDLINEVLDLSRVEAGGMTLDMTAVQLGAVIEKCLSLTNPIFAKYEVVPTNKTTGCGATVRTDPQRATQLILNLLSNAAKYNRRGGTVTVSCENVAGGFHRLTVTDTGKGIPEHKRDQLFKAFNRLGAEATEIEGTGIGLALSKSIIEAMGGRIGFSSLVDQGSRFWLDFPLCADAAKPAATDTGEAPALHYCVEDRLVLYIEDDAANMRLMEVLFEQLAPMRLITANNVEDGMALARTSQPDVVILDINLPDINGFEAIDRLKEDAAIRHIPVVGLSADATSATAKRALACGFADYLTKPVKLSELVRTISRVMETKNADPG